MGSMIAADYTAQLQALLPQGAAWPRSNEALLTRLLSAWADGFARADALATELCRVEIDPGDAVISLNDWERILGLPDSCVLAAGEDQSVAQRQAAAHSKLVSSGGQSAAFFIRLAEDLGYAGARIETFAPMTCNSFCNDALWSEADRFTWLLVVPSGGGTFVANANSPCDSPLASWGDAALECRISHLKPAESAALIAYV